MLKIIRRVLRLSGNLSKRIWGSFICGFLESMFGLLPIAAVFLVLIELQNGQPITGQTCLSCNRLTVLQFYQDKKDGGDWQQAEHGFQKATDKAAPNPFR